MTCSILLLLLELKLLILDICRDDDDDDDRVNCVVVVVVVDVAVAVPNFQRTASIGWIFLLGVSLSVVGAWQSLMAGADVMYFYMIRLQRY